MGGEQKFARFGRARVFALPSQGEGMPIAMLEAMAAGLPVVATPVGGVGDVIRDDVEGILVPPSDPSALGRALSQLVENPDRARAMGDRARERVRNAFDVRHGVDALTKLYLAAGRLERAGHESAVRVPAGTGDAEG
jgi:glycosyltransferase involved in cell wall biosynthesis